MTAATEVRPTRGRSVRLLVWLLLGLVAVAALVVASVDGGGARTNEDRARSLAATVRCPTCRGQSVLESDAATARAIRTEISRRIASGESDDEIRAYLVSVHGRSILLTPPRSGLAALVWVLPVAGIAGAAIGVGFAFRRWSAPLAEVAPADEALVRRARRTQGDGG